MSNQQFLGVTVLPEYIQSEGVGGVLDNLVMKVVANAVATSPYLMEEADQETGASEPPADAGAGAVRLLDRPLFGKREVWVRTAPSLLGQSSIRFYPGSSLPRPDYWPTGTTRPGSGAGEVPESAGFSLSTRPSWRISGQGG